MNRLEQIAVLIEDCIRELEPNEDIDDGADGMPRGNTNMRCNNNLKMCLELLAELGIKKKHGE